MHKPIHTKIHSAAIALVFCSAIFFPLIIGMVEEDLSMSKIEKRQLFALPDLPQKKEDIEKYPNQFDAYYADHFGLRDRFTGFFKVAKLAIGDSSSADVTLGKNGWMFLGSVKKGYRNFSDPMGDARNANLYTQQELKSFAKRIENLRAWLNEKGIEYLYLIAPSKSTIYFDHLPDYITKINDKSAADQLIEYLRSHTQVSVVDLRNALLKDKDLHQNYSTTGTHWNHFGANIAQYEIMKAIQYKFPSKISPEIFPDSIYRLDPSHDRDLEKLSGIEYDPPPMSPQPVLRGYCAQKTHVYDTDGRDKYVNICESQMLKAVIFRDSFFTHLEPYFSRKLNRTTLIWEKLNYASLAKYIELEKPDLVIEQIAERKLPYIPEFEYEFARVQNRKIFELSDKLIFSNDWTKLKFGSQLKLVNAEGGALGIANGAPLSLVSTGTDPIIYFDALPFNPNSRYLLHLDIILSKDSKMKLYYSSKSGVRAAFTNKNSISIRLKKGRNDTYIHLDQASIYKYIRLDPATTKGKITIKSLEIKEVQRLDAIQNILDRSRLNY